MKSCHLSVLFRGLFFLCKGWHRLRLWWVWCALLSKRAKMIITESADGFVFNSEFSHVINLYFNALFWSVFLRKLTFTWSYYTSYFSGLWTSCICSNFPLYKTRAKLLPLPAATSLSWQQFFIFLFLFFFLQSYSLWNVESLAQLQYPFYLCLPFTPSATGNLKAWC